MDNLNKIDNIIPELKSYFIKRKEIIFAYIFGSLVQKTANKLSDIDIAIFINEEDAFDGRIKIDFSKLQETEEWGVLATTKITVSYNTNLEAMSNKKVIKDLKNKI